MYKSVILRSWIMLPVLYGQNFCKQIRLRSIYFLGDLVNNNLNLFPAIKQMMELLPVQSWTVIGNHDRDADSIRINQTFSYNTAFGSATYAFNEGNVHFIVLNNVYGKGTRSYVGKISDSQLRFVSNDLKLVPKNAQIVLCMHIPLVHTTNSSALIEILEGRGMF